MKLHNILVVVMCAALPAIAYSDDDKVLKGREITESALIEALTPEAGATQTRRMRSIRVGPDVKATPTPVVHTHRSLRARWMSLREHWPQTS